MEERLRSARETAKRPVGGFLLDGFQGNPATLETRLYLLSSVTAELPEDKPRLVFSWDADHASWATEPECGCSVLRTVSTRARLLMNWWCPFWAEADWGGSFHHGCCAFDVRTRGRQLPCELVYLIHISEGKCCTVSTHFCAKCRFCFLFIITRCLGTGRKLWGTLALIKESWGQMWGAWQNERGL